MKPEKSIEWYREEVTKLIAILEEHKDRDNGFIHTEYLLEKLNRIVLEIGIGIHPTLEPTVKTLLKQLADR